MLGFFRLASFVSLGLVFTVIIIGAFLSARGQELSCSDWPLCPTGFSLSPGGKYFVEYVHRIIALIARCFCLHHRYLLNQKICQG